jgi:hypothetical protein
MTFHSRHELISYHLENLYRPLVPPPMKVLCYAALADLFKYLPASKASPQDLIVRQKLQIASWMSLWPIKFEKYRYALTNLLMCKSSLDPPTVLSDYLTPSGTNWGLRTASLTALLP